MKIKHNKLKNTAILFECLVKQMTTDFMSSNHSPALQFIKKYFKEGTQLKKELNLYNNIINSKIKEENRFVNYIDEVLKLKKNIINESKLSNEKYNIIKEIKSNYDINNIFSYNVPNYKLAASIYKLFSGIAVNESLDSFVNTKFIIIKSILQNKITTPISELSILNEQSPEIKQMATKLLIEKFNKKYSKLSINQRNLLKEYINNVENKNTLKFYVLDIIPKISKKINEVSKKQDDIIKIKLNEVNTTINNMSNIKVVTDEHIMTLMKTYELLKKLK